MKAKWKGLAAETALAAVMGFASPAGAVFLDDARLFKLTANFYTQTRVRVQDSDPPEDLEGGGTQPHVAIGQLIQWRNFANPVLEGDLGRALGLDDKWALHTIEQVGNYGEMWERDMAPLGVPRGLNKLWTKGGLMYAPPLR